MAQQPKPIQVVPGTPSGSTEPIQPAPEPQGFVSWYADLDQYARTRKAVFSTMEADKLYSVYLEHFFSPVQKVGEQEAEG